MALPTVPSTGADISNSALSLPIQEVLVSLLTDITNINKGLTTPVTLVTTASGAVDVTAPTDTLQNGTTVAGA